MTAKIVTIQKSWCPEFTVPISTMRPGDTLGVKANVLEFLRKFTGVNHVVTKDLVIEEQVTGTWASFACRSGIDNQGEIVAYWEVG